MIEHFIVLNEFLCLILLLFVAIDQPSRGDQTTEFLSASRTTQQDIYLNWNQNPFGNVQVSSRLKYDLISSVILLTLKHQS